MAATTSLNPGASLLARMVSRAGGRWASKSAKAAAVRVTRTCTCTAHAATRPAGAGMAGWAITHWQVCTATVPVPPAIITFDTSTASPSTWCTSAPFQKHSTPPPPPPRESPHSGQNRDRPPTKSAQTPTRPVLAGRARDSGHAAPRPGRDSSPARRSRTLRARPARVAAAPLATTRRRRCPDAWRARVRWAPVRAHPAPPRAAAASHPRPLCLRSAHRSLSLLSLFHPSSPPPRHHRSGKFGSSDKRPPAPAPERALFLSSQHGKRAREGFAANRPPHPTS